MKSLRIILFVMLSAHLSAQETSIQSQNFKGVKTVRLFTTEADSTGTRYGEKVLSEERHFDTAGNLVQRKWFENGRVTTETRFTYDAAGRETSFTRWDDSVITIAETSSYRLDSTGRFTLRTGIRDGKVTFIESSYFDSTANRYYVTRWEGEFTIGPGDRQRQFDLNHRLVQQNAYKGFTEFSYDSCGYLTLMLARQFEDGHCSAYIPFHYENTLVNCRLIRCHSMNSTSVFSYNDRGYISSERTWSKYEPRCTIIEADYEYY